MMGTLVQDVRYPLVTITRARGVTIAAILTLALGIGGTTAVFCVAYGVLWKPLPNSAPDRLVRVWEEHPAAYRRQGTAGSAATPSGRWTLCPLQSGLWC
jgi:hypothetical protein